MRRHKFGNDSKKRLILNRPFQKSVSGGPCASFPSSDWERMCSKFCFER